MIRNVIFGVITLLMTYVVYIYPFEVLGHLLADTALFNPMALIPTCLIAGLIFYYLRSHSTAPVLQGITHYGMGIGFIGLWVFNAGLLASVFLPDFKFQIGILSVGLFIVICIKAIWNGQKITFKELHLTSPKLKKPVQIIFISDVHLGSNTPRHLTKICQMLHSVDFDYLLIGGDLFDASSFQAEQLTPLLSIQKPIYFVTGNHEYYVQDHSTKLAALEQYNIETLDNSAVMLGDIHLIGIDDHQPVAAQSEAVQKLVAPDLFNLVMVHQPALWHNPPAHVDLMLSGHTHNGQIFPFNYLVRLQFKAVYGLYEQLGGKIYVSSGSGTWGPKMRLGTQNEIVRIALLPG
ncbi:MAG: metallophosphoesterase [Candidatus Puniceispirillaceae bacterium]